MSPLLQTITIILCLLFLLLVTRLVVKGRLQLKYSLMWMALAVVILICSIFPQIVFGLSDLLGFETPANFAYVIGFFFILLISLSLSIIASWQANYIRSLVQTVALLEKRIKDDKE